MTTKKAILTSAVLASLTGAMLAPTTATMADDHAAPPARHWRHNSPPPMFDRFNDMDRDEAPLDEMQRMMDYMRRQEARLMHDMRKLQEDMDREMARMSSDRHDSMHSMHMEQQLDIPAVQIEDKDDAYLVTINMPNADKKSIKLNLEGSVLTVSASQKMQKKKKGDGVYMSESMMSRVSRSLSLPGPVQQKGMKTKYEDGKLLVKIPKAPESAAKKSG